MEPYWSVIMKTDSNSAPAVVESEPIKELWSSVETKDLRTGRIAMTSAAGPDGVSARLLRSIPSEILVRIYNILMWCGRLPRDLLESRTIFLPKQKDAEAPGDFLPITIPPVLVRGLHKILAKRMEILLDIDPRQRAFRSTDGCADNTFLLDTLLRYHRKKYKPLYMAALDISKAFDSVSHPAIIATLRNIGVPPPMVESGQSLRKIKKIRR